MGDTKWVFGAQGSWRLWNKQLSQGWWLMRKGQRHGQREKVMVNVLGVLTRKASVLGLEKHVPSTSFSPPDKQWVWIGMMMMNVCQSSCTIVCHQQSNGIKFWTDELAKKEHVQNENNESKHWSLRNPADNTVCVWDPKPMAKYSVLREVSNKLETVSLNSIEWRSSLGRTS